MEIETAGVFLAVKDIYPGKAVKKLECVGHVQNRVEEGLKS